MNKGFRRLASLLVALMMIAVVAVTASGQTKPEAERLYFREGWELLNRIAGYPVVQDEGVPGDSLDEEQLIVRIKPPRP